MQKSIIYRTDSYKHSHSILVPENTTGVFSYFESRGGEYPTTLFFGLQPLLKLLEIPITSEDVLKVEKIILKQGLPFYRDKWQYIIDHHKGKLPLRIKAVKEGTLVPVKNVLMSIENTDGNCYWLTNFIETYLVRVWYPITVATRSYYIKQLIKKFMEETCETLDKLPFMLHDFGARSVSSSESAEIGGAAHLVSFLGTDTTESLFFIQEYYNEECAGISIPASEHSVITMYGRDQEAVAYKKMLDTYKSFGVFSCVSDSWDFYNAIENIWPQLLKDVNNCTCVIRPDSGNPLEVISKALNILGKKFGYTLNKKGFKLLNKVALIQGDGVREEDIKNILEMMLDQKWSVENICFGMGGGLLQKVHRDTLKFAFKASAMKTQGQWVEIYKDPATDHTKASKKGRLELTKNFETIQEKDLKTEGLLDVVFENGEIKRYQTFDEIRTLSNKNFTSLVDKVLIE